MTPRRGRWPALAGSALAVVLGCAASAVRTPAPDTGAVYRDPAYPAAERAADLVGRMTLDEKVAQLVSSRAPAVPRLGVRAYGWWNEAIHGVAREQLVDGHNPPTLVDTTSYPVSLSMASTWNPDLMYRVASLVSDEMREVVRDNALDLSVFSPTVNLSRDPRWGRNDETYGEDPLLSATMAAQYVDGMEGKDPQGRPLPEGGGYLKTSTTLKHYAANDSEADRLRGSSDVDERTLREYYTAQFRSAIRWASPGSVMTAYNAVNGVPASVSTHLLQTLGRQTFGFDGYYTSDCDSVAMVTRGHSWVPPGRVAPLDGTERSAWANAAGVDLNCQLGYHDGDNFATTLADAVRRGVVTERGRYTEADVDSSLVRLFTARIRLGEFDDPGRVPWAARARARVPAGTWVNSDANRAVTQTPERLLAARRAAGESLVLLANRPAAGGTQPLLPLRVPATGPYRLAVVGPSAAGAVYLGGYSSIQEAAGRARQVGVLDGLRAAVTARNPGAVVDHVPGLTPGGDRVDAAALAALGGYDAVVVVLATGEGTAAEDADRPDLALPGAQAELAAAVAARNPRTAVYLQTIGAVDVRPFAPAAPALLWSSYGGQRVGEGLADVLLGAVSPSGRLPFTWYAGDEQLPAIGDYRIRPAADTPGRTYQYFTGTPAYPFGHGLGYTTFRRSAPRPDRTGAAPDDTVTVGVDVTNTGPVPGADVVQLYASTPDAPAALERPRRRLVAFRKVFLTPGETVHVDLPVRLRDLAFFDARAGRSGVDEGTYRFTLGPQEGPAADVRVAGRLTPVPVALTARPATASDAGTSGARVSYPVGAVVEPHLTLATADDALSGELSPGRSVPLPAGAQVSLVSDRPQVVAVEAGVVRARAPGVATVTATVRHLGGEASARFVVLVR